MKNDSDCLQNVTSIDVDELSNVAASLLKQEKWNEAIAVAKLVFSKDALHINTLDAFSHAYGAKQNWDMCAIYGALALQLRDREVLIEEAEFPTLPVLSNKQGVKKNIIAFSLFGNKSAYIEPAVLNAELVNRIYPGWICRFYVDESVPDNVLARLTNPCSEVVKVTEEQRKLPGTMWRFLAMDDSSVNYILFRDADSVISQREAKAVQEWIASGRYFHTIRDSGSHTELILAGLWGARAGSVPCMQEKMKDYMDKNPEHHRFSDQFFLRDCVWKYVRQDLYASDRIFGFMNAHPIPDEQYFDYNITHIGCNEGSSLFTLQSPSKVLSDGAKVKWSLYSKIDGLLNEDLSYNLVEERLICEYVTTVEKEGSFTGHIPRRYARGFSDGTSRIEFSTNNV